MTAFLKRCTLALAAVLVIACGGNPNKPEPVCTEPGATNPGQPLPCKFPEPVKFTETRLWVVSTDPGVGSSLQLTELSGGTGGSPVPGGGAVTAKVGFEISEEHLNAAKSQGKKISLNVCLSVDGTKDVVHGCSGYLTLAEGQNQGVADFKNLRVIEVMNPGVVKTAFLRLHAWYTSASASDVSAKVDKQEWEFKWFPRPKS